jgi:hypothetical protein
MMMNLRFVRSLKKKLKEKNKKRLKKAIKGKRMQRPKKK